MNNIIPIKKGCYIPNIEVKGRTLVNLLGRQGNAIYSQLCFSNDYMVVATERDTYVAINKVGTQWYIRHDIPVNTTVGKYYISIAEIKCPTGGSYFRANNVLDTQISYTGSDDFEYYVSKFIASDSTKFMQIGHDHRSDRPAISPNDKVYFRNLRVYEITKEEYESCNVHDKKVTQELVKKYPYVDDVKCVVNPYIESKENLLPDFDNWTMGGIAPDGQILEDVNHVNIVNYSTITHTKSGENYTLSIDGMGTNKYRICLFNMHGDSATGYADKCISESNSATIYTTHDGILKYAILTEDGTASKVDEIMSNLISGKWRPVINKGIGTKSYEECHNSRIMFETKLYDGETISRRNNGTYVKNSEYGEVILDSSLEPLFHATNSNGSKQIRFENVTELRNQLESMLVKYNGNIIPTYDNGIGDKTEGLYASIESEYGKNVYMSIPNTLTGWGDNYTPTQEEVKAFFLGWRMYKRDQPVGDKLYDGVDNKAWIKLWNGIGPIDPGITTVKCCAGLITDTLPTTINDQGYTPYRLIYKKETPTVEGVVVHGSLVVKEGVDVKASSGLVLNELAQVSSNNPQIHTNGGDSKWVNRCETPLLVKNINKHKPFKINTFAEAENIIIYGSSNAWFGIRGRETLKEGEKSLSVNYLIYRPDTVLSYEYTLHEPSSVKETLEKIIDELSNTNEKLSAENRALHNKIDSLPKVSNPNLLINGDFQVWQRGESFINAKINSYTSDRWLLTANSSDGCNIHAKKINSGINLKYERKKAAPTFLRFGQFIENPEKYVGKEVTLSFKIKNVSISNHATDNINFTAELRHRNSNYTLNDGGVPSICRTTFTNLNQMRNGIYSCTGVLPNDIKKLCVIIHMQLNDTSNTNGVFELDLEWVKLEAGGHTPLISRTYAEELAMCQRYFETGHINMEYCINSYHLYSGTKFFRTKKRIFQPSMKVYPDINNKESNVGKMYLRDSGGANLSTVVANISAWNSDMFIVGGNNSLVAGKYVSLFWEADAEIY